LLRKLLSPAGYTITLNGSHQPMVGNQARRFHPRNRYHVRTPRQSPRAEQSRQATSHCTCGVRVAYPPENWRSRSRLRSRSRSRSRSRRLRSRPRSRSLLRSRGPSSPPRFVPCSSRPCGRRSSPAAASSRDDDGGWRAETSVRLRSRSPTSPRGCISSSRLPPRSVWPPPLRPGKSSRRDGGGGWRPLPARRKGAQQTDTHGYCGHRRQTCRREVRPNPGVEPLEAAAHLLCCCSLRTSSPALVAAHRPPSHPVQCHRRRRRRRRSCLLFWSPHAPHAPPL
jgi:hypothetical protein